MKLSFDEMRVRSQKPEKRWQGTLLSLDPGHTTGYAVWKSNLDHVDLIEAGQIKTWEEDLNYNLYQDLITKHKPQHAVFESYQVYEWKSQDHSWSQVPTIQVIGAIKVINMQHGITYSSQTAQVAKQFCTDERLTDWGYYKPGLKHARDAIRHGCYYLLFRP